MANISACGTGRQPPHRTAICATSTGRASPRTTVPRRAFSIACSNASTAGSPGAHACVRRCCPTGKRAAPPADVEPPAGLKKQASDLAQHRLDVLPVHQIVEPSLEVLRPRVAVVDVVAVLPHIDAEDGG